MKIRTRTYAEKPRTVDAVKATDVNIMDVAEWVSGERKFTTGAYDAEKGHMYLIPLSEHGHCLQVRAGDYVVKELEKVYVLPGDYFESRWELRKTNSIDIVAGGGLAPNLSGVVPGARGIANGILADPINLRRGLL
jgi:hypothetical protein